MIPVSAWSQRRTVILSVLAGLLLTSMAVATAGCLSSGDSSTDATVSKTLAPDFAGTTLEGAEVSLNDYAGQPLVLVFMASWCGPCREEAPEIEQFYQENKDRAALLAMDVSDSEEDIRAFMTENGLTFPMMLDGDSAAGDYRVNALPTTVVINPEGYIIKRIIGGTTAAELSTIVDGITR